MTIKAVIFDQDGVLIDSEPIHYLALKEFFSLHGFEYELKLHEKFFGYNPDNFFTQLHENHGFMLSVEYMKNESKKFIHNYEDQILLMPNAEFTLSQISNIVPHIGLATGTYRSLTERNLQRLQIKNYFQKTICGDEINNGKPHPEIYLKTAEKLGCAPKECLVIEDAPAGIESATQAGMQVVSYLADHNRNADLSKAHFKIKHLPEIIPILRYLMGEIDFLNSSNEN